jgi:DNA adenine methylase
MSSSNGQDKMISSPFKWVGGKSRLRKQIIDILPPHTCYVEPFAGAAWVLFGKTPSPVEILNDIDQELVNFFRVVKEKPELLIKSFELELVARVEFEKLAELDPKQLTDVDRAHRFYYLIMAGWGGELNYPRFQTSITDGGHGNRLIGALKTLRSRIEPVHKRLSTVIVENLDWKDCIDRYDRPGAVMYIDPPYPGNKCNYAHNMRNWEDHEKLVKRLGEAECKWILSSYDNEEVRKLFGQFYIMPVQSFSGMRVEKNNTKRVQNNEALISNFQPCNIPTIQKEKKARKSKGITEAKREGLFELA